MLLRTAALVDRASFDQDGARQLGECLQVLCFLPNTSPSIPCLTHARSLLPDRSVRALCRLRTHDGADLCGQSSALAGETVGNRPLHRSRRERTSIGRSLGRPDADPCDSFSICVRTQLEAAPSGTQKLLEAIANHAATSDSSFCLLDLDPPGRTSDLITLAGILLDYATAYCVSSEYGSNCLGGRELQLIEAFSVTAGGQRFEGDRLPPMFGYNSHRKLTPRPSFALPGTPSSRSRTPPRLSPPGPRWNR